MGLFNAYNSVMQINKLVAQLEYQIDASNIYIRTGNCTYTALIEDEKRIEAILYEIADIMTKSTGARVAAYHFKGSSMKIETIIEFGLEAMKIIESRMPEL
jgi:ADP-glucose pyrophosphorylase